MTSMREETAEESLQIFRLASRATTDRRDSRDVDCSGDLEFELSERCSLSSVLSSGENPGIAEPTCRMDFTSESEWIGFRFKSWANAGFA